MKIGIPRALLYYRYKTLWETFFRELGHEVVVSPMTDKLIMEAGNKCCIDENCLSSKLFMGHVAALEGKCDAVFVPRIANFGKEGIFCSRFEALYDMAANIFRDRNIRFIECDVDEFQKKSEAQAYIGLGVELGAAKEQATQAYVKALTAQRQACRHSQDKQDARLKEDKIKILVIGHSYNLHDAYIGLPIINALKELDVIPLLADAVELDYARKNYTSICKDVPWIMNRELLGAIHHYHDYVDGIVLITAFPCGPDSMLNEMIIRRVKDRPILNLLLDSQDGSAGIETRLESFVDIIRFRKINEKKREEKE